MDKINFENLPSTNTPLDADTLNEMQSNIEKSVVAVGSTEPSTNEKVCLKKGKNLFNKNLGFTNAYVNANGNIVEDNNNALCNHHIPVIAGQSYTAKANQSVFNMYLTFYDKNGNYILGLGSDSATQQTTVIAPTNAKYALFQFNYNGSTAVTSTIIDSLGIIVVQGTTAPTYEPYVEKEILVKNDNGVFEEFYNEDNYIKPTIKGNAVINTSYISYEENNLFVKKGNIVRFDFTLQTKGTWSYATKFATGLPKPVSFLRFAGVDTSTGDTPIRFAINTDGEISNWYSATTPTAGHLIEGGITYITTD